VNPGTDCDRVRLQLMAARDGEAVPGAADPRSDPHQHLASCSSCERWLRDFESMNSRFQGVSYPGSPADLWAGVEARLRQPHTTRTVTRRFWIIGASVLAWRALQLLIDLPFPVLHPLVPLACALAALWAIARDPLAIETFAPELQKRGI
jgi:hypothetical protein